LKIFVFDHYPWPKFELFQKHQWRVFWCIYWLGVDFGVSRKIKKKVTNLNKNIAHDFFIPLPAVYLQAKE
jgi:hypothetical protein